jgi:hypothetical protein
MHKLIYGCQSTFINGRNIMDGIVSLHEMIHEAKGKKQQGIILKLDFEKSYDKVDWEYLSKCISQIGFSPLWCNFFDLIVKNGTLYVKINDKKGNDFGSHRGVRQGDTFSPFLINIAVEGLAKKIHKA